jgi:hypothetical protein
LGLGFGRRSRFEQGIETGQARRIVGDAHALIRGAAGRGALHEQQTHDGGYVSQSITPT